MSLLAAAETHAYFTGCWSRQGPVHLCVDPSAPPVSSLEVQCEDCLTFRLGALASLLPAGYDGYRLARDLTAHVTAARGYAWAVSEYHAGGNAGFWFSAVSFGTACCSALPAGVEAEHRNALRQLLASVAVGGEMGGYALEEERLKRIPQ